MTSDLATLAEELLDPLARYAQKCHQASYALAHSGLFGEGARVARGGCRGVPGQHSWLALGDPYAEDTEVVDATLWSYDDSVEGVWVGPNRHKHTPHGAASIWTWGRPPAASGEPVQLRPRRPWSDEAERFLAILGPLDLQGWRMLANAPVLMWPAAEIIDAMLEDERIAPRVPIDIAGMLTDRNPSGLYW